jgi:CDP-glucose 4,6-dehydratase
MGARVLGYALEPPTVPSLFEAAEVGQRIEQVIACVRDAERVGSVVRQFEPDTVFHLAAQPLVRQAYRDPVGTFDTNVMGTVNVLEAVRRLNRPCSVVVITSDKVYQNREWHWGYRETDALGGHDPYSASKACTELVTSAYRQSYFADAGEVGVATGRAGNVVGGGDFGFERLVPDAMRAFASGQPLHVRSPNAVRPWQHVLEPLFGYLKLAERLAVDPRSSAEAWNFGPRAASAVCVGELASLLSQAWGPPATWTTDEPRGAALHETTRLEVDASLARARLGVYSRLSVEQTLQWTVKWYKAHAQGAAARSLRDLCLEQIADYGKLAT